MNSDENTDLYKPGDSVSSGQISTAPDSATSGSEPEAPVSLSPGDDSPVSWTALEYIDHTRGSGWYILLTIATVVLALLVYLITKDYFAAVTIAVVGIIAGVFAARKPRQMEYELNQSGLTIGGKHLSYGLFKSFSIFKQGEHHSIDLLSTKRFTPPISIYFDPADEEKITAILGERLPLDERQPDSIDRLSHRLRF
jgi:hypothetical protein